MQLSLTLLCACLAHAVDMSRYYQGPGVEDDFALFLKELYHQTELLDTTTDFMDFFTPDGQLKVLNQTIIGPVDILAKKQALLPINGRMNWDHFPNMSTVYEETETEKTYVVLGINNRIIKGMNCSAAYYSTRFTVKKDEHGVPLLQPQSRNLVLYDDYIIDPSFSPTDIPCAK